MAKKTAKKNIVIELPKPVVVLKKSATTVNEFVISSSEEVIDFAIEKSGQLQSVTEKAIKSGLKMTAKNQDFVFTTLESIKSQLQEGSKKVAGYFSKN